MKKKNHYIGEHNPTGSLQNKIFAQSWEFGPTDLTPTPLPVRWDSPKGKKLFLFCILGYSKHIICSWKSLIILVIGDFHVIFDVIFGDFLVGTGEN